MPMQVAKSFGHFTRPKLSVGLDKSELLEIPATTKIFSQIDSKRRISKFQIQKIQSRSVKLFELFEQPLTEFLTEPSNKTGTLFLEERSHLSFRIACLQLIHAALESKSHFSGKKQTAKPNFHLVRTVFSAFLLRPDNLVFQLKRFRCSNAPR